MALTAKQSEAPARDRTFRFNVYCTPGAQCLVELFGDLDMIWSEALYQGVASMVGFRPASLVIDLRGLTFIDSSGIGFVLHMHQAFRTAGLGFWIVRSEDAHIYRVFQLAGLADHLPFVDSPADVPAP